jgi:hypothetical protein
MARNQSQAMSVYRKQFTLAKRYKKKSCLRQAVFGTVCLWDKRQLNIEGIVTLIHPISSTDRLPRKRNIGVWSLGSTKTDARMLSLPPTVSR